MATFRISTIDGKEIVLEHDAGSPTNLANLVKNVGQIHGVEIVAPGEGGDPRRGDIAIMANAIVAIRRSRDYS